MQMQTQTDRQTLPKTIPARSIAGAQVNNYTYQSPDASFPGGTRSGITDDTAVWFLIRVTVRLKHIIVAIFALDCSVAPAAPTWRRTLYTQTLKNFYGNTASFSFPFLLLPQLSLYLLFSPLPMCDSWGAQGDLKFPQLVQPIHQMTFDW